MTAGSATAAADRLLVTRYLESRDEGAFRALYEAHAAYLWAFVLRLTGRREAEAEDVFQDTWMTAARRLPAFRWDSTFRTWLCGIALNCWRAAVRRSSPATEPLVEPARDGAASYPTDALDLERAIAALPEGYRTVLVLYGVYGYTHAEIAAQLGIAEGTSKSQLARARAALRHRLANGRAGKEIE